jgi:hypothetical protein
MEFVMYVPRLFNIDVKQFEKYLLMSGWKRDMEYFDSMFRFTPKKYKNIQIVLPRSEDAKLIDKEHIMRIAVETLSQYIDDDIESVIESINDA